MIKKTMFLMIMISCSQNIYSGDEAYESRGLTSCAKKAIILGAATQLVSYYMMFNSPSVPCILASATDSSRQRMNMLLNAVIIPAAFIRSIRNTPAFWNQNPLLLSLVSLMNIAFMQVGWETFTTTASNTMQ